MPRLRRAARPLTRPAGAEPARALLQLSAAVGGEEGRQSMSDPNRSGEEAPTEPPPGPFAGETETAGWVIPGNVGSLDDVPEGMEGVPVAEEEPPDG